MHNLTHIIGMHVIYTDSWNQSYCQKELKVILIYIVMLAVRITTSIQYLTLRKKYKKKIQAQTKKAVTKDQSFALRKYFCLPHQ